MQMSSILYKYCDKEIKIHINHGQNDKLLNESV